MKNKKGKRLIKIIIAIAYIFIITLACFDFYNLNTGDEIDFTLLYFYILIPIITLIASIYIGKEKRLNKLKWLFSIIFAVLYISPLFGLIIKDGYTLIELFKSYYDMMFNGLIISLIGIIIGSIVRKS